MMITSISDESGNVVWREHNSCSPHKTKILALMMADEGEQETIDRIIKFQEVVLTLQEAASGMHPEWQGGADSARPYKNQFRGHFDPIF